MMERSESDAKSPPPSDTYREVDRNPARDHHRVTRNDSGGKGGRGEVETAHSREENEVCENK